MSRKYGKWIGKPNGVPEDPERCVEEIQPEGLRHTVQCPNPRGHGENGEYCEEHTVFEAPAATTTPAPAPRKTTKKKTTKKRSSKKKSQA